MYFGHLRIAHPAIVRSRRRLEGDMSDLTLNAGDTLYCMHEPNEFDDAASVATAAGQSYHPRPVLCIDACSDERMIVELIRLVHTIEGVTGVESQIRHIAFQPST